MDSDLAHFFCLLSADEGAGWMTPLRVGECKPEYRLFVNTYGRQ